MKNKLATFTIVLLLACPTLAAAARQVDETRPAAANGSVSIELVAGKVRVEGWNKKEVRLKGILGDEIDELEFESSGRDTSIELVPQRSHRRGGGTDITVQIPAGSELEIEAVSGHIEISGVTGRISVESVAGWLEVRGKFEEVEISSISGVVDLRSDAALRRVSVESVSGKVEIDGDLASGARLGVESVSGQVLLRIPENTPARYEISTFSGDISNSFGPRPEKTGEFLPGKSLEFTVGAGSARVHVNVFSGRVELQGR